MNPHFAAIPVWQFTGFFNERLMVCLMHGAFVSVALWRLRDRFVLGERRRMTLHFFGNFPIYLMPESVWLWTTAWSVIVNLWWRFISSAASHC